MSGFVPSHLDEAGLERQFEEYRRHQALQGHSAAMALARARQQQQQQGPPQAADFATAMLQEAGSPYFARQPGGQAYGRISDPYAGLTAGRGPFRSPPDQGALAQLYAVVGGRQPIGASGFTITYNPTTTTPYGQGAPPGSGYRAPPGYGAATAYGIPAPQSTAPSSLSAYSGAAAARETLPSTANRDTAYSTTTSSKPAVATTPKPDRGQGGVANVTVPAAIDSSNTPNFRASPKSTPPASTTKSMKIPSSAQSKSNRSPDAPNRPKTPKEKSPSDVSEVYSGQSKPKETPQPKRFVAKDGTIVVGGKETYYMGSLPLGLDDDKYWLSELQVYLRANFAEAFAATEEDIAAPMHGRNKPIALGQVGIRCKHCKSDNPAERGQQATSYPSLISGIYNSVQQMLRLHLDCCQSMPTDVRSKIEQYKVSCSSRGGRKQYWIDSARRLGLVDTQYGIHFGRDPYGPLPPLTGPSVNSKEGRRKRMLKATQEVPEKQVIPATEEETPEPVPNIDDRPLVFEQDKPLISDYLYLTLEQMAPCTLMEADRVGCYKTRKVGFPGLACKHCVGQAGCGRYFPASEASLSQTTTSQTIMNHVRNCRRCPTEIRENLEIMKRNRMGPDGKRADKPKHGGRKVFFHRLWCRIQGLEIDEESKEDLGESPITKKRKGKKNGKKKRKKSSGSDQDSDDEAPGGAAFSDEDDETESEEDESELSGDEVDAKSKKRRSSNATKKKVFVAHWFPGCVRLTKNDDPHWLSEMECFARSELVEVFSLESKEDLSGYGGRKEPDEGQVGVRCIFCKSLSASERPSGCVAFPESLATIHVKVTDMIRLHFPGCPAMPDEARDTFKSLRGFDAKVANDDAQQYWIDAARDIGLSNSPPKGAADGSSWGITFRRDPLQPSPADELDLENNNGGGSDCDNVCLVHSEDRGLCTDQVMLLLRQVQPCRFKKSDRRAGPGYRGRDRAMGFPGLSCRHCAGQNTLGRYFPVSAKNMTDCTSNSLQSHVLSCGYCPEPIRASLAYLGHRSILQKAELRGCWKKAFFKKVWDRLHTERKWTTAENDEEDDEVTREEEGSMVTEDDANQYDEKADDISDEAPDADGDEDGEEGSDSEKEELGDAMNALIKAAAIWLTQQDAATELARASSRAAKSSRSAPIKKASIVAEKITRAVRTEASLHSKRRRVHF